MDIKKSLQEIGNLRWKVVDMENNKKWANIMHMRARELAQGLQVMQWKGKQEWTDTACQYAGELEKYFRSLHWEYTKDWEEAKKALFNRVSQALDDGVPWEKAVSSAGYSFQ